MMIDTVHYVAQLTWVMGKIHESSTIVIVFGFIAVSYFDEGSMIVGMAY